MGCRLRHPLWVRPAGLFNATLSQLHGFHTASNTCILWTALIVLTIPMVLVTGFEPEIHLQMLGRPSNIKHREDWIQSEAVYCENVPISSGLGTELS